MKYYPLSAICLLLIIFAAPQSRAEDTTQQLPSPLSLEKALELLDPTHPDIEMSTAKLQEAKANLELSESSTGLKSYLDLIAARTRPTTMDDSINDSYARLVITKTLYDFGQSSAETDSLSTRVASQEKLFNSNFQHHQLEIMKRFFDVLLADMRYAVDDEQMTQLYLKYDKKRERADLGMISNVEVQEAENLYREALIDRTASDRNMQSTRLILAIALNRPGDLPDELSKPDLSYLSDEIPEVEPLYQEAMKSNPVILSAQQEVDAAQLQIVAERNRDMPVLSAQFELGEYEVERESRDTARAQLVLRVPIYQSGKTRASIDRASALHLQQKAKLKKLEQELLLNIAGLIKELNILKTKKQTATQRLSYRDLDLEKRRALYEMEAATNMSEKQAAVSEAQWHILKLDFEHALIMAKLNLLLGKPMLPKKGPDSP